MGPCPWGIPLRGPQPQQLSVPSTGHPACPKVRLSVLSFLVVSGCASLAWCPDPSTQALQHPLLQPPGLLLDSPAALCPAPGTEGSLLHLAVALRAPATWPHARPASLSSPQLQSGLAPYTSPHTMMLSNLLRLELPQVTPRAQAPCTSPCTVMPASLSGLQA